MSDTTAVSPSCWHIHPIKYMSPSFKLIKTLVQLPTSFLVKITHGSKYEHVYAFNHTRVNISPHIKKSKLPISPPVSRSKGRETKATKDYQENLSNPNVKLALFISCKQPRLLFWMERQAIDLKKNKLQAKQTPTNSSCPFYNSCVTQEWNFTRLTDCKGSTQLLIICP